MKLFASAMLMLLMIGIAAPAEAQRKAKAEEMPALPELPFDEKSGKVTYTEVVEVKGTKDELYAKLGKWFRSHYTNPSSVITDEDKDAGQVKGKHRFNVYATDDKTGTKVKGPMMLYTINVICKDGRYKYKITDIKQKGSTNVPIENVVKEQRAKQSAVTTSHLIQTDEELKKVVASLKKGMAATAAAKDADW